MVAGVLAGDNASDSTLADARCVVGLDFSTVNMDAFIDTKTGSRQRTQNRVVSHHDYDVNNCGREKFEGPAQRLSPSFHHSGEWSLRAGCGRRAAVRGGRRAVVQHHARLDQRRGIDAVQALESLALGMPGGRCLSLLVLHGAIPASAHLGEAGIVAG